MINVSLINKTIVFFTLYVEHFRLILYFNTGLIENWV